MNYIKHLNKGAFFMFLFTSDNENNYIFAACLEKTEKNSLTM